MPPTPVSTALYESVMNGERSKSIRGDGNRRGKPGGGSPLADGAPRGVGGLGDRQFLPAPTPAELPVPGATAAARAEPGRAQVRVVFCPPRHFGPPPTGAVRGSRPGPRAGGQPPAPGSPPPPPAGPGSAGLVPPSAGGSPSHRAEPVPVVVLGWGFFGGCFFFFFFSFKWDKLNLRNGTGRCKGTGRRRRQPGRAAGLPRR